MSILTRANKLSRIVLKPQNIFCETKYLFVLGHMRSRSTLLSHILGSNPNICGHGELHHAYLHPLSLMKIRLDLNLDSDEPLKNKYLLDKLLHNRNIVSDKVLETIQPKVIFLIRQPESALKSIINMGRKGRDAGLAQYEPVDGALDYYVSRLAMLEMYANKLQGNYFFIESDELINQPDDMLARLSVWLELEQPLDKNYSIFHNTGKAGTGDMSKNIKSGKILKTKGYPDIQLSPEIVQQGWDAYISCKETLTKYDMRQAAALPQFA